MRRLLAALALVAALAALSPGVGLGQPALTPHPPLSRADLGAQEPPADVPSATPEQLAVLAAILDRPEFRAAEGRTLLDRLLDPVRGWLRWLLGETVRLLVRGVEAGGDAVPVGLAVAALAVIGIAGLYLRRLLRGRIAGEAALADSRRSGPPRAADERDRARAFAAAGDARRAIHHHYLAVLRRLDERDHFAFDGALTNRELLPRLAAAPALAGPFAELVARFDRLWYGQADCSADEYADFARLADRVWQAADATAPARAARPGMGVPLGAGASTGGAP